MRHTWFLAAAAFVAVLPVLAAPAGVSDQLWEYRNLGKAFYENPDTHKEATEQFRQALQLAPNSIREQLNYGLALLRSGDTEAGIAALVKVQKEDAALPHTWFNLGIAYKRNGDYNNAGEQLRGMMRLVPDEAKTHYNLGAVLRSTGKPADAIEEFKKAESLDRDLAGPHFQLFTLYQRSGKLEDAARERKLFEEAKKKAEGSPIPEDMEWCYYAELYDPPEPRAANKVQQQYDEKVISLPANFKTIGTTLIDIDGNGQTDVLVWSSDSVVAIHHGADVKPLPGLQALQPIRSITAADFNNDGLADLCIVTDAGATLYRNEHGNFAKWTDLPGTAGANKALAIDYDHDYDLDIMLLGQKPILLRNNGTGDFTDKTVDFPFEQGEALDATVFAVREDTSARDVVVSYRDHAGVLYHDLLNGKFEALPIPELVAGAQELTAQDFNHDGLLDLVSYQPKVVALQNTRGKLVAATNAVSFPAYVHADLNGDRREDYLRPMADGSLHAYLNRTTTEHWISVQIKGVKNLKAAEGATVEVKSGPLYDKQIFAGTALAFAVGDHADADAVRITWPNGLIQNEMHKKANELASIPEAQKLAGSCPMIFTWNGEHYQFITDVLGVAPLGASSGDGNYFPVNHEEYIQIPGAALRAKNGDYEIHITEELHEVSYLDQVKLIAVDHPAKTDIYTNERFKSPPYPKLHLYGSERKFFPIRAAEDDGSNVQPQLLEVDQQYPSGFRHNTAGVAERHSLTLDFGDVARDNRAVLILNGWVDWADGSTFLGASQDNKGGLAFPYVQVKDAKGQWKTVVEDMGMPSGKPKTIAVDLTGKFLSSSREVRIVTNLCVYWDQAFLEDAADTPDVHLTPVASNGADLHFRGFSHPVIDKTRQQPERFLYDQVQFTSGWNPTSGNYTRYGDVQKLVTDVDDRLVVMGSGDELKLRYPAGSLPALPVGWTRDFLLLVDGWAKDADANTAFSQSVEPLPFHGMSAYPYKANERFPADRLHAEYQEQYLTRPALRLIRPLTPAPNATAGN